MRIYQETIMKNHELEQCIAAKLATFNARLIDENLYIRAFFLEYDQDFEGMTANLIYIVKADTSIMSLDKITEYCNLAYEQLKEEVEFTYCIYRTESEYEESYSEDHWADTLIQVNLDAILQPA